MKFTVTGAEQRKIISDYLQNLLQGGCEFVTESEYALDKEVVFIENTDAYKAQKEKDRIEMEKMRAKWAAEDAAKKAAQEATDAATRG